MANTLGVIFGFFMPNFFIDEQMAKEEYKTSVGIYLFWEFMLSFILCFPTLIFMKSKPNIPPR